MFIIQMADLHIGSEEKSQETEEKILKKGLQYLKTQISEGEKILICICGDVIDSKGLSARSKTTSANRYKEAAKLIQCIQDELQENYDIKIRFCLGNHDVTHVNEFVSNMKCFDSQLTQEKLESAYIVEFGGITFVFVNSCHGRQYAYGAVDYETLEKVLRGIPKDQSKVLILHHTVMSMYLGDASEIRDSAKLLNLLQDYNIMGILHGHIHGREQYSIGNKKCQIIGTGALFSRNYSNVNSQFNLIELTSRSFREIASYIYVADDRVVGQNWLKVGKEDETENCFKGRDFGFIYRKLMSALEKEKVLNNVVLKIKSPYDEFVEDLEKNLGTEKFHMGKIEYDYFKLAEMWESIITPPELYFNHGSYFKVWDEAEKSEVHAIQYIAGMLKAKPTTNKAVLTTYNTSLLTKKLKGNEYVPSLLSIQFSCDEKGKTLCVHMYLRALEAEQFLKINICEIVWLIKKLKEQQVVFEEVDIAISAFRVQKKKNFSCFLKTEIDKTKDTELMRLVFDGKVDEICRMLNEKKDTSETITNFSGIQKLCESMEAANCSELARHYDKEVIHKLRKILEIYQQLDELHRKGSVQTKQEEKLEKEIQDKIAEIISNLEKEKDRV